MTPLLDYLALLEALPPGTLTPAAGIVAEIRSRLPLAPEVASAVDVQSVPFTWRERLWLVPDETRLGVAELAEALGRPRSWVYRRTGPATEHAPLPCRKLDGELVFAAGEIRAWIEQHESVVTSGPTAAATPITPLRRRTPAPPHSRAS